MTSTSGASTRPPTPNAEFGIVVIGRNEGERLRRCLASVVTQSATVVYVDSMSSDSSVSVARSAGVRVVEMGSGMQPTAALTRNLGLVELRAALPTVRYVMF